ncbi:unnamed protein product, partial [Rotaria sp. Silwood1]
ACMAVGTFFMVEQAEATESTTPQNLFTSLTELNKEFHRHYIQARDDLWRLTTENDAAAIASLNSMHRAVQNWMNEHNINRHDSSIKVIVIGARAARQNHLDATYFEYLLGANQKRNIFYVEEIYNDEKKIISMFSSWYLEEQLSNILFDDNNRMHSDLLMTDNVRQYMIEQLISC